MRGAEVKYIDKNGKRATLRRSDDFSGIDLSGCNLRNADFSQLRSEGPGHDGVDLSEADFTGADLTNVRLYGSSLGEADFTDAVLIGADLSDCYLVDVNLTKADLTNADLSEVNLDGAMIAGAVFRGAVLWGANLCGLDLTGADISEAKLEGAYLADNDVMPSGWELDPNTGTLRRSVVWVAKQLTDYDFDMDILKVLYNEHPDLPLEELGELASI
jgi:uncharacterized protein YjbI with pentapeptide repeats